MKTLRFVQHLTILAAVLLIAGCTVGPDYQHPGVDVPQSFRGQTASSEAASIASLPWWQVFKDKALQGLITEALSNSYDLQAAVARVEEARALVGVAKSEAIPQVGYNAFGGTEKTFVPQGSTADSVRYNTYGGLLNAAWELDVWGRIRRSTESAEAKLLAQEDVRRGVILTLVSDTAANYFQLLELDRELAVAQESAATYKRTLDLFSERAQAGKDSDLAVARAQAAYSSSLAAIAALKRQIAQQENAINVLTGSYPRAIKRGHSLTKQVLPKTPTGATTELLQRRPDILQAEQVMISANADIGVAVANFYPRVGLSALLGSQAADISDSFENFSIGNVLGNITGPLFTGGRLQSVYEEEQAFWDEAVVQYRKVVLTAFRETSDALIARRNLVNQRAGLEKQVEALRQAVDLALLRYDGGRASYFEVLEAQQQLFPAETALAQVRRDQLVAVVNLYKALGGGWQSAESGKTSNPTQDGAKAQGG